MKIFNSLSSLIHLNKNGVSIAIGNFDGIHSGHQQIIKKAVQKGQEYGYKSGVLTFKDHPQNILHNKTNIKKIISNEQRMDLFKQLGLDFCIMLEVTPDFFLTSAKDFINNILINTINAKVVVVGKNFRFGHFAHGTAKNLQEKKYQNHFQTIIHPLFKNNEKVVCSTDIRDAINKQDFTFANSLLGRKIFFTANVESGKKIGRTIGFPTANINFSKSLDFKNGVYTALVWLKKRKYDALMNIGLCPTVSNYDTKKTEIYLLDYKGEEFYGEKIHFQIKYFIRKEKKFNSLNELRETINKDKKQLIKMLKNEK